MQEKIETRLKLTMHNKLCLQAQNEFYEFGSVNNQEVFQDMLTQLS